MRSSLLVTPLASWPLTEQDRRHRAYVTMDGKIKGRGALSNQQGRFARYEREPDLEALAAAAVAAEEPEPPKLQTTLHVDRARTIIARNSSPDIPFSQSINPYRGCEHGCIYCYARATHSYLDLSPGRDFETEIFYKPNAVELLRAELAAPRLRGEPDRSRHQYRSLSARRTAARGDARHSRAAARAEAPCHDRDERRTHPARPRRAARARRAGPGRGSREPHDARRRAQAAHGAAHCRAEATARR